jgi:peroxiredoxin Q/BCP
MLTLDTPAPAWLGLDQDGVQHSSDDYRGQWLLLYFYPKDDTPGCTKEACGIRDRFGSLSKKVAIVGVSADSVQSHKSFVEKYRLPFTLIADTSKTIIKTYGASGIPFAKRISFLVRPDGTIAKIYPSVDPAVHAEEIERDVDNLSA